MGRFDDLDDMMSGDGKKTAKPAKPKPTGSKAAKPATLKTATPHKSRGASAMAPETDKAASNKKRTYVYIGENTELHRTATEILGALPPGFSSTPLATIVSRFLSERDDEIAAMLKEYYRSG